MATKGYITNKDIQILRNSKEELAVLVLGDKTKLKNNPKFLGILKKSRTIQRFVKVLDKVNRLSLTYFIKTKDKTNRKFLEEKILNTDPNWKAIAKFLYKKPLVGNLIVCAVRFKKVLVGNKWNLAPSTVVLFFETIASKSEQFKKTVPVKVFKALMELSDVALETPDVLFENLAPTWKNKILKIAPEFEVKPEVLSAFKKTFKNLKIGNFKASEVIDKKDVVVLELQPKGTKVKAQFVLFFSPYFMRSVFNKMERNKLSRLLEKYRAGVEEFLKRLKKELSNVANTSIKITYKRMDSIKAKQMGIQALPLYSKSADEVIEDLKNDIVVLLKEVMDLGKKFHKNDVVYVLDETTGDYKQAKVTKVNKDGTINVRIGKDVVTVDPFTESVLTEKEYAKLVVKREKAEEKKVGGKGTKKKVEKILSPEELQLLKELGIEIEE